jgi:hypothetical protein
MKHHPREFIRPRIRSIQSICNRISPILDQYLLPWPILQARPLFTALLTRLRAQPHSIHKPKNHEAPASIRPPFPQPNDHEATAPTRTTSPFPNSRITKPRHSRPSSRPRSRIAGVLPSRSSHRNIERKVYAIWEFSSTRACIGRLAQPCC